MPENINKELFSFANTLADVSGGILRHGFNSVHNVRRKYDLSPVTQMDIDIETRVRSMIEEKFPEHGIIGEELGRVRENAEYQWVIDPIDGTKSFIAGYPIFTTLISLLHNGVPILGIINQPILHERWAAISGQATLYNNSPLNILNNSRKLAQATIATTSIEYFSTEQADKFAKLRLSAANSILGGDGYAYAMLTKLKLDMVLDVAMKLYDFCALVPIIEGVGGVISDWSGNPLTASSTGDVIASASKNLHSEAIKFLA